MILLQTHQVSSRASGQTQTEKFHTRTRERIGVVK